MILFVVHLAGAAALLIWSVRLVRTGVERAFMAQMRRALRRSDERRGFAVLVGTVSAVFMQSSTAVALLSAGFVVSGALGVTAGIAVMLGADLGSAIAAQILLARADWLIPLLLIVGAVLFLRTKRRTLRQTGRILIGLALVFVSLDMIGATTEPLGDSEIVTVIVGYLDGDPLSAFVLGAVMAYAMHSSLASVLLLVTFAAAGVLSVTAGAAMVLGANLGGAVIPFVLTLRMPAEARRVVVANLVFRGGGALLALAALTQIAAETLLPGAAPGRQIINMHLGFNLVLVLAGVPLAGLMARATGILVPESGETQEAGPVSALDDQTLATPDRALACASRELLRMAERVAGMLAPALDLYRGWNDATARSVLRSEDQVDTMHFEIKLFLTRMQEGRLTEEQSRRSMDLVAVASSLEEAGDQISGNLLDLAKRMQDEGLVFSADGWQDLTDFHDRVLANARLALDVLMADDPDIARQLLEEKDRIRRLERLLQERHLERLRQGSVETVATSNLHQETLRALKQVNTALCFVAYPIAEQAGDLRASRLVQPGGKAAPPERPEPQSPVKEAKA